MRADDEIIYEIDREKKPKVIDSINPSFSHPGKTITQENIWGHGPNGCSNEKTLIKSINAIVK